MPWGYLTSSKENLRESIAFHGLVIRLESRSAHYVQTDRSNGAPDKKKSPTQLGMDCGFEPGILCEGGSEF